MNASAKVTVESFVGLIKQSGLIEVELLKKACKDLKDSGAPLADPHQIADEFVKRNLLTRWQADKLLQGRYKSFFLGKYRLLSHLGSGGMSAVYLAEHVLMRRRVAIKVLPRDRINDSSYLERFHREAQAVAALDHRNIVRAYDVDQEGNNHFLVMEYVPGQSLHALIAGNGPLDFIRAAEYMRQAADGLYHAHRMGMVHRDIKPGNLLLDEKGIVKLLDLGLARFFDDKEESSLTVKHDEKVLGTADYLSPEQALNSHNVDVRSDIYSLGCTLYFLLVGHPPFPDGTLAQRLLAHQTKQPQPIQELRPESPPGLNAILEKMMAKKPEDRYQTAKEAGEALLQWLNEAGGSAWAEMNPPVQSSSQIVSNQPGSASSNVLSGDQPRPATPPTDLPLVATAVGNGAPTTGPDRTDSGNFVLQQLAGDIAASETVRQGNETADPDMAALFSEIASEATTTISRPPGGRQRASDAKSPEPTGTPASRAREPEPTMTMPDFAAIEAGFEAPAPAEPAWPVAEPISFEPPRPVDQPTDTPAILVPVSADPFAPTLLAAEVPAASPPVATPVAIPVASPVPPVARQVAESTACRPKNPPRSRNLVFAGAGVLAVTLAVGGYLLFGRSASSTGKENASEGKPTANSGKKSKKKTASGSEKIADLRGEFAVGPDARFKTITAVLAELKTFKNNKSRNAVQIVKVAAGQTFAERIVIDDSYPRNMQFIAEPGPAPVLAPTGPEPVVAVRSAGGKIENFHLEGFRIDAAGKDIAVEIAGWAPGARLKRLEIGGFGKTGVLFNGAQTYGKEEERIVLEAATLRGATPAAVGVQISRKTEDSAYIRINQCRFFGPCECGVLLDANARGIEISESIFSEARTGVKLTGEERTWNDLLIGANTFYQNDRAIVFTNMPTPRSGDLQFHNNLFVTSKTADVVVEKDYKAADFYLMYRSLPGGSGYNWTTRPASDSPKPDEIVTLFETVDGRRNVGDLKFVSTDPASADFLAPAVGAPQRQRGTMLDARRFGAQIGAVRPK